MEQDIDDDAWRGYVRSGLRLLRDGTVSAGIGLRVPLARAAEAHAAMARREVIGKTVLTV